MPKTYENKNSNASSGFIKWNKVPLQTFPQSKDIVPMESSSLLFDSKSIVQTATLKMH